MSSKYYLAIFNVTSWREFLANGARVDGITGLKRIEQKNSRKVII